MNCLVTGAGGFIGSHLVERLLSERRRVIGLDCFRGSYDPAFKRNNIAASLRDPLFDLVEADLSSDFESALNSHFPPGGQFLVFHLAAQDDGGFPGGPGFDEHVRDNVVSTRRLLEWVCGRGSLQNFVFASSYSVYGDSGSLPMSETRSLPVPASPHAVTKLAAEHLVRLYTRERGMPSASLRLFTVFGPRQRPGMAFHRFILAALRGRPVEMLGDGRQTRDFTFVSDAVEGLRRAESCTSGGVYNLGTGSGTSLLDALAEIEEACGQERCEAVRSGAAGLRARCRGGYVAPGPRPRMDARRIPPGRDTPGDRMDQGRLRPLIRHRFLRRRCRRRPWAQP